MHDDLTRSMDDGQLGAAERQQGAPHAPEARSSWGSFRLLARVGYGGFGEVYRAWDPNLEREVALKLLLPNGSGTDQSDAEYKSMLREARAMASVRHPNIVTVYGIDRQDGRVGFWMDFVRGKTLAALLGSQGPFGYREAALIGLDVSRALSAVHRTGLLHRDIKAENVMREEGGRILLFITRRNAPNGRLMMFDAAHGDISSAREILPASDLQITDRNRDGVLCAEDAVYVYGHRKGVSTLIRVPYDNSTHRSEIELPFAGGIADVTGDSRTSGLVFSLTDNAHLFGVYKYDPSLNRVVDTRLTH